MAPTPFTLAIWLVLMSAGGALSEPAATLPPAERQSLEAFAASQKACAAWSDGCVICKRQDGDVFACSTPGIACLPSALACQEPAARSSPPAKDAH